jgi:hypothetical protein
MLLILAISFFVGGFFVGWLFLTIIVMARISRVQERMERKVHYWQSEASAARVIAEKLSSRITVTGDWAVADGPGYDLQGFDGKHETQGSDREGRRRSPGMGHPGPEVSISDSFISFLGATDGIEVPAMAPDDSGEVVLPGDVAEDGDCAVSDAGVSLDVQRSESSNGDVPVRSFGTTGANVDRSTLPVTIYLSEERTHYQVEAAVEHLLDAAGLRVQDREEPVIGSWFRRMRAATADVIRSPVAREGALVAAHVADTRIVLSQDAAVTATLLQNLGPVIGSLQPTRDAVLRVGALLIVKVDWVVTVVQLTAAQQALMDHRPQLACSPREIISALDLTTCNEGKNTAVLNGNNDLDSLGRSASLE